MIDLAFYGRELARHPIVVKEGKEIIGSRRKRLTLRGAKIVFGTALGIALVVANIWLWAAVIP